MAEKKIWRVFKGLATGGWAGVCPRCGYLNVFGASRPLEPECKECSRRAEQARQRRLEKGRSRS